MQDTNNHFYQEFETSVSAKGQITLPVYGRKRLGIEQSDTIRVRVFDDGTMHILPKCKCFLDHAGTVPALKEPLTIQEMRDIIYEERAKEYLRDH